MKKTRRKLNKKFVIITAILLTILIISTTFLIIVKHNNKDEDIRIKIDDIKGNTYKYNIKDQYTNVTKSSITFNDDGKTGKKELFLTNNVGAENDTSEIEFTYSIAKDDIEGYVIELKYNIITEIYKVNYETGCIYNAHDKLITYCK